MKGCIRSYYLVDGEERTTEFYTEGQSITPVSYVRKEPSLYYLSCVEDSVVAVGSAERNQQLIEQVPALTSLLLQLNSELLVENRLTLDSFKNLSPEERYLQLQETRPELLNRVPLAHLATYLGITPVSLSRMRKRILKRTDT
jgi:CRP-like cAMP-binding protein